MKRMSDSTFRATSDLRIIKAASYVLSNQESQDRTLVVEMVEHMLSDVIASGALAPLENYIRHYCTVIDNETEAEILIDSIRHLAIAQDTE